MVSRKRIGGILASFDTYLLKLIHGFDHIFLMSQSATCVIANRAADLLDIGFHCFLHLSDDLGKLVSINTSELLRFLHKLPVLGNLGLHILTKSFLLGKDHLFLAET
jgi:hypothetical protein